MDSSPPPPPPPLLRQGPRPLPLHLLLAGLALGSSRLAWPHLRQDWPSLNTGLRARSQGLAPLLDALDPAALQAAVAGEAASRASQFLEGLAAYRAHPYRRELPDPPLLWQAGTTKLYDYGATHPAGQGGRPLLVVPSLVNRGYILDLMPGKSLLRWLAAQGLRPFLVEWGAPGPEERRFGLTDYVCGRLEAALDQVLAAPGVAEAGEKPRVLGYCMGGMLALALALRRQAELAGLVLMATPWDFHAGAEEGAAADSGRGQAQSLARLLPFYAPALDALGELPLDPLQALFTLVDPLTALRKFQAFARMDPAGDKAQAFVALEDWLNDGMPLAAAVAREALGLWYGQNTPARGQWRIAGRPVLPAELRLPTLALVPKSDRIVPPGRALALARAIPGAAVRVPPVGHLGMVVSGAATGEVWEVVRGWADMPAI